MQSSSMRERAGCSLIVAATCAPALAHDVTAKPNEKINASFDILRGESRD